MAVQRRRPFSLCWLQPQPSERNLNRTRSTITYPCSGGMGREVFLLFAALLGAVAADYPSDLFTQADSNNDGVLSRDE